MRSSREAVIGLVLAAALLPGCARPSACQQLRPRILAAAHLLARLDADWLGWFREVEAAIPQQDVAPAAMDDIRLRYLAVASTATSEEKRLVKNPLPRNAPSHVQTDYHSLIGDFSAFAESADQMALVLEHFDPNNPTAINDPALSPFTIGDAAGMEARSVADVEPPGSLVAEAASDTSYCPFG